MKRLIWLWQDVRFYGVRYWFKRWRDETLPFWIARKLPRRIAYFAFIRVHAASEAHWPFDAVARHWEERL